MNPSQDKVSKVTVCAECNRASCWQGKFMCDESDHAGTKEMTKTQLRKLKLEDPHYWKPT